MSKFKVGEPVFRCVDIWKPKKGYKHGVITRKYSKPSKTTGDVTLGPYPELYEVLWDDGKLEKGFLPHGLYGRI